MASARTSGARECGSGKEVVARWQRGKSECVTSADRTGDLLDGFGSGGFGLVNSDSQVKDARAGLRQRKKRLESLRLGGRG
jgi:hypothetical protein